MPVVSSSFHTTNKGRLIPPRTALHRDHTGLSFPGLRRFGHNPWPSVAEASRQLRSQPGGRHQTHLVLAPPVASNFRDASAAERRCTIAWDASPRYTLEYRDASRGATMVFCAGTTSPAVCITSKVTCLAAVPLGDHYASIYSATDDRSGIGSPSSRIPLMCIRIASRIRSSLWRICVFRCSTS